MDQTIHWKLLRGITLNRTRSVIRSRMLVSNVGETFLPDRTLLQYQLRKRSHDKIMISKTADLNDRDFIVVRMLYKDSYFFFKFLLLCYIFLQLFYSFLTASVQLHNVNCL